MENQATNSPFSLGIHQLYYYRMWITKQGPVSALFSARLLTQEVLRLFFFLLKGGGIET